MSLDTQKHYHYNFITLQLHDKEEWKLFWLFRCDDINDMFKTYFLLRFLAWVFLLIPTIYKTESGAIKSAD